MMTEATLTSVGTVTMGYGVKPKQNGANLFSNHPKQPIDCSITERSAVPLSPRSSSSVIVAAVAVEAQSAMMKMQMAQSSPHL